MRAEKTIRRIVRLIRDNRRFIIASHQNLEGDALGSQLALARLLRLLGKKVTAFSPEPIPRTYSFLPGIGKVAYKPTLKSVGYDVACVVDCTGLDRLGWVRRLIRPDRPIINIDHHTATDNFGTVNWVAPELSCSGEQIYHLFKKTGIKIDKSSALCIYTAMLTDTGSFRYSNTTARTHDIAAELIAKGLMPAQIYRKIYEGVRKPTLDLLSVVLSSLKTTRDGNVAWVKITKNMCKRHKAGMDGTEDFISFPRSIKGIKVAIAFREISSSKVKAGFRSNDDVDVCRLARLFGGGGHPSASGCTINEGMREAEKTVLQKTKQFLRGRS